MITLELFLQNCLHNPIIRIHPAFIDFLSLTDEGQFKEHQPQYERAAAPIRPSEFVKSNIQIYRYIMYLNKEGVCEIEISQELKSYCGTLHDYLKNSHDTHKKLSKNFKKLNVDLESLASTLGGISDCFTSLSKQNESFCKLNTNMSNTTNVS